MEWSWKLQELSFPSNRINCMPWSRESKSQRLYLHHMFPSGFSFSFLHRIPPSGGNGISGEISLNFGNFDRKVILNSKNEISLHSDRNFGQQNRNFGDFDWNFGFVTVKWCKLTENDVYIWKNWKFWQNFPWLCVYWQFIMHNIYITPQNNDKYTI